MLLGDRGSRWRCLLVWASGTSTLGLVALSLVRDAATLWSRRAALGSLPVDVLLQQVSAGILVVCAAWAWLALTATVADAWRGAPSPRCGPWRLPVGVRRVVLAACGVAMASALATPAQAEDARPHHRQHGVGALSGLPLPERAVAPPRSARSRASQPPRVVTVRAGDTLWAIAGRDLPAGATDADVTSRWQGIYAANHHLIGPDPDLIRPGQHLHLPPLPLPRKDRP